jgi:glycosyltransferase involved in cell wall biosynthesis
MSKFKILILNSSAIYGGGEYFVLKLASRLRKKGHDILAGCRVQSLLYKKLKEAGINTIPVDFPEKGSGGLWKNVKAVKKIIIENNINIVHSNTGYDRTTAAFAVRGSGAKHVTSCHSLESISHNLTHYIRNKYLTHHFIADGSSIKDLIITKNNIPPGKVTVIHNGIDPEEMSLDNALGKKIRSEFNINDNEILIGSVGRLVNFKGYRYLVTAFKIIQEKIPGVKLMIVGDGELMDSLKAQAKMLKLDNGIIFTGFRDDLQAVYSAFDIYANTSIEGGGELFPFSILYAMAQALPVVASKVGDIPEMISNNESGLLVDERSPYQTAERLLEVINNKINAEKLGEAGKLRLLQKFTMSEMTEKIENVYRNVINIQK